MAGHRPTSRGARPGTSARARIGSRPGLRPGAPRPRAQAAARDTPPPRPRFTGRAAILVLVLAVLMVSYASSMRAYLEQRRHLESLQASIDASKDNIAALEREKARWEDPAYLRAQARERFGWVLPGEIGFQVIDEDGEPLGREVTLSDAEPPTDDARPLWWQAAWDSVEVAGNPDEVAQTPKPAERIRLPRQKQR